MEKVTRNLNWMLKKRNIDLGAKYSINEAIDAMRLHWLRKGDEKRLRELAKSLRGGAFRSEDKYQTAAQYLEGREERNEEFLIPNLLTGEVMRAIYIEGHNGRSSPDENYLVVASPWVHDGKRVVRFSDSGHKVVLEATFQAELKTVLKVGGFKVAEYPE